MLPKTPDSLRAELELVAFDHGRKSSVAAVLAADPGRRYKLDLFGLPGMVAASFYWLPETWTLALFDRSAYAEGAGEHVEFGNLGIHEVSVHDVFSALWGGFFPGLGAAAAGLPPAWRRVGVAGLQYSANGQTWTAELDPATGQVRSVCREDSAFRAEYLEYSLRAGRPVPTRIRIFSRTGPLLEIRVKSLEDNPHWRRNPFFLKVPAGFRKLERGDSERFE